MAVCKLCLQDRPLVEGHVLSEFLYADVYDPDSHKFHQLHTEENKRNVRRSKGLYEYLMCDECDNQVISGYETYASQVLRGGVPIVAKDEHDRLVVTELNYTRFKLFQLSLLWRSVIATRDEFSGVTVPAADAERMRHMLLTQDAGEPQEYGCIMMIPETHHIIRHALMPTEPAVLGNYEGFRLLAGGCWWLYMVADTHSFEYQELFLSEEGTLQLIKERHSTPFLRELAANLVKNSTFPTNK